MKPNIVVISLDSCRKDSLSFYDDAVEKTPNIEKFVKNNNHIIFENAISQASYTTSSYTSLLTSCLPPKHGIRSNFVVQQNQMTKNLVQKHLKKAGYYTKAVVSTFHLEHIGIEHFFDEFIFDDKTNNAEICQVPFSDIENTVKQSLSTDLQKRKPFFLFVHTYDLHGPNPEAYKEAIKLTDDKLKPLLDFCQNTPNTITIITSDHGYKFYDDHNGTKFHFRGKKLSDNDVHNGIEVYDELIKVPLSISWNFKLEKEFHKHYKNQFSLIDLFPSILRLFNIETKYPFNEVDGKSFNGNNDFAFSETYIPGSIDPSNRDVQHVPRRISMRYRNEMKFIFIEEKKGELYIEEIYNLEKDPKERDNLLKMLHNELKKCYNKND